MAEFDWLPSCNSMAYFCGGQRGGEGGWISKCYPSSRENFHLYRDPAYTGHEGTSTGPEGLECLALERGEYSPGDGEYLVPFVTTCNFGHDWCLRVHRGTGGVRPVLRPPRRLRTLNSHATSGQTAEAPLRSMLPGWSRWWWPSPALAAAVTPPVWIRATRTTAKQIECGRDPYGDEMIIGDNALEETLALSNLYSSLVYSPSPTTTSAQFFFTFSTMTNPCPQSPRLSTLDESGRSFKITRGFSAIFLQAFL